MNEPDGKALVTQYGLEDRFIVGCESDFISSQRGEVPFGQIARLPFGSLGPSQYSVFGFVPNHDVHQPLGYLECDG